MKAQKWVKTPMIVEIEVMILARTEMKEFWWTISKKLVAEKTNVWEEEGERVQ